MWDGLLGYVGGSVKIQQKSGTLPSTLGTFLSDTGSLGFLHRSWEVKNTIYSGFSNIGYVGRVARVCGRVSKNPEKNRVHCKVPWVHVLSDT